MPAAIHARTGDRILEYSCGTIIAIGRTPPNDIVLDDGKVSRNHALIRMIEESKYYILDMGSSNGTFVNGQRVVIPTELNDGDAITIGDSLLTFSVKPEPDVPESGDLPPARERALSTIMTVRSTVQYVTILVTDIRDYSGLSANMAPHDLASVIGRLFRDTTAIVERNRGVIDKFIGDAVMARWSSDRRGIRNAVFLAIQSVRDISSTLEDINSKCPGLPAPLRIGAGINSGEAVLGNVGAKARPDYTVLGDCVNLAFRFEAATKELKKNVVLGSNSYRHLPPEILKGRIHRLAVKGKQEPVKALGLTFAELGLLVGDPAVTAKLLEHDRKPRR